MKIMSKELERIIKSPWLDRIFDVSIILKGADGLLETVGGLILLFITPESIRRIVDRLTAHELSQDPHDFVASHLVSLAHSLTGAVTIFISFYLISHGLVKVVLVIALLKQKLWAYPWMIGFLFLFTIYQIYQMVQSYSLGLILLTLFDIFIIFLTYLEYKKHLERDG